MGSLDLVLGWRDIGVAATAGLGLCFLLCLTLVLTQAWHGRFTHDGCGGVQKFHEVPTPRIGGLAVAMVVASGLQRRPWGLGLALGLQVATIACGLLVPALAVVGLIFAAVWTGILLMGRVLGVLGVLVRLDFLERRVAHVLTPWPR